MQEIFQEKQACGEDWRVSIKDTLLKEGNLADLKTFKDYILVKGELYRRMPEGIFSRCVGHKEAQRKLKEVHGKTCRFYCKISLYRRLQRTGFYWPSMGKDADLVQTQCEACHLATDKKESYAVFTSED